MTRRSIIPPLSLLLAAGCTAHPTSNAPRHVAQLSPRPVPKNGQAPEGETPPPPEAQPIAPEVMGWVVISDGAKLTRALSTVVGAGQPQAPGSDPGPDITAKVMLARALGLDPHLAEAIDLGRPAAAALL